MNKSVCMASYNGENFIRKQIESILDDLDDNDELIIVDDCSSDKTIEEINKFDDSRIKLLVNPVNMGEVYSFNKAILNTKNDYIFLSDQDDIWLKGRSHFMAETLAMSSAILLTSNFSWIDEKDRHIEVKIDGVSSKKSKKNLSNIFDIFIGKTNYFGCAMVFKKNLIGKICPIPKYVESHDLWIALAANLLRSNMHTDEFTFKKRYHSSNATRTVSQRSILMRLYSRLVFLISIFEILKRLIKNNS